MEIDTEHDTTREEAWVAIPGEQGGWQGSNPLSEQGAHLWALVLESRAVPCSIEHGGPGWHLLVPASRLDEALNEIQLFEEENRHWPPPAPPANPPAENTLTTLSILVLLATFHNLTRLEISLFGHAPLDWFAIGSADAAGIMAGQWWRSITALTLHSDVFHLFGNLALGGFFIVHLCGELGSGLAWSLILGSGILGNLANAWLHAHGHSSVGASTGVFGALGILAALTLVRHINHRQMRWLQPVAAAVALLALLGTEGERTDLGAHLFGFVFGMGLGMAAGLLIERHGRPGRILNALLAAGCALAVLAAWWTAIPTP